MAVRIHGMYPGKLWHLWEQRCCLDQALVRPCVCTLLDTKMVAHIFSYKARKNGKLKVGHIKIS